MTLPASSFAEAKRIVDLFADSEQLGPYIFPGEDIACVQFNIPFDSTDHLAAYHMIAAAASMVDRAASACINGEDVLVRFPTSVTKQEDGTHAFPAHAMITRLHDLRRLMLRGLGQEADGTVTLSLKTDYPGLKGFDMRDMVQSLVNRNQIRHRQKPSLEIGTQYRNSEEAIARLQPNAKHRQSLSERQQQLAASFDKEYAPNHGTTLVPDHLSFDSHAAKALYTELGVDVTPGRYMN